jgi:broad specificity phosphatase PhoE
MQESIAQYSARIQPGSRIAIIRHGEARSNADDTIGGHESCLGLTDLGRAQVTALADRLVHTGEMHGAVALYSSILPRAVETAEILAPALGGLRIQQSCDFCEMHVGIADGLTWQEYEAAYGPYLPGVDDDRDFAPGGESWTVFVQRVEKALLAAVQEHPGQLVVVAAHGGVIWSSVVRFLGLPGSGAFSRGYAENSSITEWEWTGRRWWFVRYNDVAHLEVAKWQSDRGLRIEPPSWVRGGDLESA